MGAFQEAITTGELLAMCRRVFGEHIQVLHAVELGNGMYNTTYRVTLADRGSVILRVAPEAGRQFVSERELMRNEYASLPYLAPIASLMPRTLAADFTHELVGRDYLFQTCLGGVPAAEGLARYPRAAWAGFFRQMGSIARRIHDVRGARFGVVGGRGYLTWSAALLALFGELVEDTERIGVDAASLVGIASSAERDRGILDEIVEPRLLHGDLWIINVMVADPDEAEEPVITGVFDCDRTLWGDPEADWTIEMVTRKPGTERDAFWDTYGKLNATPEAVRRRQYYRARHLAAIRLEAFRLGKTDDLPRLTMELEAIAAGLKSRAGG
ncbi:phosphotransferase family protein [Nonomuraea sp. NBC_01738]|uniref:phosphotransferase family protein n=1 Tax=Nonomuraea sp. NBC_01738 TaxID=2976003 RepID=UPI003FA36932